MAFSRKEVKRCYKNLSDREALSESLTKITSEIRVLKKQAERLEKLKIKMQEELAVLKYKISLDEKILQDSEENQENKTTFSNYFKSIERKT